MPDLHNDVFINDLKQLSLKFPQHRELLNTIIAQIIQGKEARIISALFELDDCDW